MTSTDRPDPARLDWRWDHPAPPRWLLIDEYSGEPDTTVAVCAEIDGLFRDPRPDPPVERYTLIGCTPAGPLRAALDGTGGRRLGDLVLDPVHPAGRKPSDRCYPVPVGCFECMEELLGLTVVGHRPSATVPGLVDVEIEGRFRFDHPRHSARTPAQPPDADGYLLTAADDGVALGTCRDVRGVFRFRPEPPVRDVVLRGCRPEPRLLAAIEANRSVSTTIHEVAADGTAWHSTGARVFARVTAAEPSELGAGLLDVTFDRPVTESFPSGAREIWDLWYAGGPTEPGGWIRYGPGLRDQWSGAALRHQPRLVSDRPAGTTYHLDGRHVTEVEGFYCAIGEAINGPGGYFGWNLDALHDCVGGGWGAGWPFRIVWHYSAVARAHLVPRYDRRRWGTTVTLDRVVGLLAEDGIEVELR